MMFFTIVDYYNEAPEGGSLRGKVSIGDLIAGVGNTATKGLHFNMKLCGSTKTLPAFGSSDIDK